MDRAALTTLEYEKIKQQLLPYAVSGLGRRMIEELQPSVVEDAVRQRLQETAEARRILDAAGHVPLHGLSDVSESLEKVARGGIVDPGSLLELADFLRGCRKLAAFMKRYEDLAPTVSRYARSLADCRALEEIIETCIENNRVSSAASQRLAKIRSQIETIKSRIKDRINSYITSGRYRECLQESIISMKDDRYCIAVKSSHRNVIDGTVIATSGSGSTVFIEPAPVRNMTNELKVLLAGEEAEQYQVLAMLSGEIGAILPAIRVNVEIMAVYDFSFAKAKYSRAIAAVAPASLPPGQIIIRGGRHPLLGEKAVPLDFFIGKSYRTLLITGPNTGGKTVALKTIGLFVLMAQSGLHLPAGPGTALGLFDKVLADIGDQQSIEQSLSTFSAHMTNVIRILREAGRRTLVLLDEIGTGTDPAEGSALGAAVLDDLYEAGAVTVATTHYGELKRFSDQHEGFLNGCMDFDPETLMPLYRLQIGQAGRSNGIWIAEKLGMKASTLLKARDLCQNPPEGREQNQKDVPWPEAIDESVTTATGLPPAEPGLGTLAPEPRPFRLGDSVYIGSLKEKGILCKLADSRGETEVLVKGKRIKVNMKRLELHIPAEELYPDGYDLNIVLLSKEDRRLVHQMGRKHVKGAVRFLKEE